MKKPRNIETPRGFFGSLDVSRRRRNDNVSAITPVTSATVANVSTVFAVAVGVYAPHRGRPVTPLHYYCGENYPHVEVTRRDCVGAPHGFRLRRRGSYKSCRSNHRSDCSGDQMFFHPDSFRKRTQTEFQPIIKLYNIY